MHIVYNHMYICVSLYVQITDELLKLQKEQEELQSKLKLRVIGLSLFATVLEVLGVVMYSTQSMYVSGMSVMISSSMYTCVYACMVCDLSFLTVVY